MRSLSLDGLQMTSTAINVSASKLAIWRSVSTRSHCFGSLRPSFRRYATNTETTQNPTPSAARAETLGPSLRGAYPARRDVSCRKRLRRSFAIASKRFWAAARERRVRGGHASYVQASSATASALLACLNASVRPRGLLGSHALRTARRSSWSLARRAGPTPMLTCRIVTWFRRWSRRGSATKITRRAPPRSAKPTRSGALPPDPPPLESLEALQPEPDGVSLELDDDELLQSLPPKLLPVDCAAAVEARRAKSVAANTNLTRGGSADPSTQAMGNVEEAVGSRRILACVTRAPRLRRANLGFTPHRMKRARSGRGKSTAARVRNATTLARG